MKVAKVQISPKALKKLSAVPVVMPKVETEFLDAIVLEEVTAHKFQTKVGSKSQTKSRSKPTGSIPRPSASPPVRQR